LAGAAAAAHWSAPVLGRSKPRSSEAHESGRTARRSNVAATGDGRTPEIGAPQARFDELLLGVLTAPIELAIQF
jgi:hypothetical protein